MLVVNDWKAFLEKKERLYGENEKPYFSVALGNFDGMHLGHQKLIQKMVTETKGKQGYCAVFSFFPHPMEVIWRKTVAKLMTVKQKEQAIADMGVDGYIQQQFDDTWMHMSAEDFICQVLIKGLHVNHIYIGFNHSFGYLGKGNASYLKELGQEYGVQVTVIDPVLEEGEIISSSAIRHALADGALAKAEKMLGYPFCITGEVVKGRQLGRVLGFPTANIIYPWEIQPVLPGVYGVYVDIDGKLYPGVANCGYQPTIDENNKTMILEVHILDEKMDLYGKEITTFFVAQIRPEMHFKGLEDLKKQIAKDCQTAKKMLIK